MPDNRTMWVDLNWSCHTIRRQNLIDDAQISTLLHYCDNKLDYFEMIAILHFYSNRKSSSTHLSAEIDLQPMTIFWWVGFPFISKFYISLTHYLSLSRSLKHTHTYARTHTHTQTLAHTSTHPHIHSYFYHSFVSVKKIIWMTEVNKNFASHFPISHLCSVNTRVCV